MNVFNAMQNQVTRNIEYANRFKNLLSTHSCVCIITNVNEKNMTVDVTVPSMGSKLFDVQIATNIIGDGSNLRILPTKDQKGIVLMSSQHAPMLVAIVSSKKQENSYILNNEAMMGTLKSFFKVGNDDSILLKTPRAMIGLSENKASSYAPQTSIINDGCTIEYMTNSTTGNSFCRETYFFRNKKYVCVKKEDVIINDNIDKDIENSVLNENDTLISKMSNLLDTIETFNSSAELGSDSIISELTQFKKNLSDLFMSQTEDAIIVEKGESYYNNDNGFIYSIRSEKNGESTLCFSIPK